MFTRHPATDSLKTPSICLFLCLSYVPFLCFKLYSLNFAFAKFRCSVFTFVPYSIKAIHKESLHYSKSNWLRLDKDDG